MQMYDVPYLLVTFLDYLPPLKTKNLSPSFDFRMFYQNIFSYLPLSFSDFIHIYTKNATTYLYEKILLWWDPSLVEISSEFHQT